MEVPALPVSALQEAAQGESSAYWRERIAQAVDRQQVRNAQLQGELLDQFCALDTVGTRLLSRATETLHLSARGYHRVLRVARSIADLEGSVIRSVPSIWQKLSSIGAWRGHWPNNQLEKRPLIFTSSVLTLVLMDTRVPPNRSTRRWGQCRLYAGYGRHPGEIYRRTLRIFGDAQALVINQTQVKIRPGASEAGSLTVPVQGLRPAFDDGAFLTGNQWGVEGTEVEGGLGILR